MAVRMTFQNDTYTLQWILSHGFTTEFLLTLQAHHEVYPPPWSEYPQNIRDAIAIHSL